MSGILLKLASVGNLLRKQTAFDDKTRPRFYFDANGFVGAVDSL
ncbi:phosphoribosylformyl-glycineamide synthetase [Citrobacter sp. CRE-46]|nr:phosphoribosylformyl-glycineamide synthetase [Citrobacter sp. CRE-46]